MSDCSYDHIQEIQRLQKAIREIVDKKDHPLIGLQYQKGFSNTTRTKSYNKISSPLDVSSLHHVLHIDPDKKKALVEPRVTMKELVHSTLSYGLLPPVVPEFKGITVGGAIMGAAAESSSHLFGTFNDSCSSLEWLGGDGTLWDASPQHHKDLFYAIPGSYGSLGLLTKAEIPLIPAQPFIILTYHFFHTIDEGLFILQALMYSFNKPDFLDGLLFSPSLGVIIEGSYASSYHLPKRTPRCHLSFPGSMWYFQHVQTLAKEVKSPTYVEYMTTKEYLFRHDKGAFWMGAYLFNSTILSEFFQYGLRKKRPLPTTSNGFSLPKPHRLLQTVLSPYLDSQRLYSLLHRAEEWVNSRFIIQDFCLPESEVKPFIQHVMDTTAIFPLWLCPIKKADAEAFLSPHLLLKDSRDKWCINVGVYGSPCQPGSIQELTRSLEMEAHLHQGRKVLYSRSFYAEDEFWNIYSKERYDTFRKKLSAKGVWPDITAKVLSE